MCDKYPPPPPTAPPTLPPRPSPLYTVKKDYVTQRSTEGLAHSHHPRMEKKSLSQGDDMEDESRRPSHLHKERGRPPHLYEEIKPKLIYVDVDLSHRREV